ncbi:MAG: DUF5069 domain-containing protein [Vulcanimicrobiaceae bacterium]
MDLTTSYPHSAKAKMSGVVMIARTTDKGKAEAEGTIGEYHYNCPMDQAVFGFLGIDHDEYLNHIKSAKSDAELEAYVAKFAAQKTPAEIDQWNAEFLAYGPAPGSDGEKYFLELRAQVAADRTDVTAWSDLLDLDEKREVPRKTAV